MVLAKIILGIVVFAFCAHVGVAQQTPLTAKKTASAAGFGGGTGVNMPSDAEIKAFLPEWKNPADPTDLLVMYADFRVPPMTSEVRKKFAFSGRVPFRLTAELKKEIQYDGNRRVKGRVTEGLCHVIIVDAQGTIVKRSREPLSKIFAAGPEKGGYLGDVPKEGKYKAIVWIKTKEGTFGKVLDVRLQLPYEP